MNTTDDMRPYYNVPVPPALRLPEPQPEPQDAEDYGKGE